MWHAVSKQYLKYLTNAVFVYGLFDWRTDSGHRRIGFSQMNPTNEEIQNGTKSLGGKCKKYN